jgi:hypothetical protein
VSWCWYWCGFDGPHIPSHWKDLQKRVLLTFINCSAPSEISVLIVDACFCFVVRSVRDKRMSFALNIGWDFLCHPGCVHLGWVFRWHPDSVLLGSLSFQKLWQSRGAIFLIFKLSRQAPVYCCMWELLCSSTVLHASSLFIFRTRSPQVWFRA